MSDLDLKSIRAPYLDKQDGLTDEEIATWSCPYALFSNWITLATKTLSEPNAMTLATATASGIPSARMVLLKDFSESEGFTFFTNYEGRKARELEENPNAALVLYWPELHRSVRIEGTVKKVTREVSEDYFYSRSKASQVGSAVSAQSRIVPSRKYLWDANEDMLKEETVAMPNWGGFAVTPNWIEFWQGQSNRLHDRIVFSQKGFDGFELDKNSMNYVEKLSNGWSRARLAP